ncbi:MAG: NAD(+)/NADH kinase [Myxococcota bacterium]|nr:NAD(+)/NADH kinase [Deltaproteobacteria bacterium]MDQ3341362.1 NAD(+)/NADH kinase [Myxococcota bacterium]
MSRVGFILKPDKTEAGALLEDLVPWLLNMGHVPVVTTEDQIAPAGCEVVPEAELGESVDLAVVLGGDGTMLRAARVVADHKKAVLGINLGSLGFLTGFSTQEAKPSIERAIAGKLPREERMRLAVKFVRATGGPNDLTAVRYALNDAVLHQGAMARLVEIEAFVDDQFVAAYRADGLIVSTPTGSTAYNMAAGGPIVVPGQNAMTLTPICAHALTNRPLVIPANATIRLGLGADVRGVMLTVDAQWAHSFLPGDFVEMTAAASPLILFRSQKGFFDVMRDKLHWGAKGGR